MVLALENNPTIIVSVQRGSLRVEDNLQKRTIDVEGGCIWIPSEIYESLPIGRRPEKSDRLTLTRMESKIVVHIIKKGTPVVELILESENVDIKGF